MKLHSNPIAKLLWLTSALKVSLVLTGCASPQKDICESRVIFKSPQKIQFNKNEKLLLCGDPTKESWKDIPPAQAEFTVRSFLKQRAYYSPKFEYKDDLLWVDPGPLKTATQLGYDGLPEHFNDIQIRDVIGKPLTSELLDRIEGQASARLKNLGYACPSVKLQASIETGEIHVFVTPGPKYIFQEPILKDDLGLYPKTMRRFDAFQLNAPYRYEWVKLSSNRGENDGIVISSQYNYTCPAKPLQTLQIEDLALIQQIMTGDHHLLTLGVGASTEEFPIGQMSLKSVRLNDRGASLNTTLYGSQRIQKLSATYTDYLFKNAPRFDLAPNATILHDVEQTYNISKIQISSPLEYRGDLENHSWLSSFGPSLSRQYADSHSKAFTYFSLLGRLMMTSHDYELYASDPRSGWSSEFNLEFLSEGFSAHPLAAVYRLSGSKLLQLNPVDPPQWIMGFRYALSSTLSQERPLTSTLLPPQYFNTLGGDQSLRGFGRNEVTGGPGYVGQMTSAYFGAEIRYAKTLLAGIEPFLFFDVGALGQSPFDLESIIYYSPGTGIRWSTPFGAIRFTIAHGYLSKETIERKDREHLQIFVSFGREF